MRKDRNGVKTVEFKYLSHEMESKQIGEAALNDQVVNWK